MLSKREKYIMNYIYKACTDKGVCIIPQSEIFEYVQQKFQLDTITIEGILRCLEMDDYIDIVKTEKEGIQYYCITLHFKGKGYLRELQHYKRQIYFKVILTVATAILGVILTKLLLSLF